MDYQQSFTIDLVSNGSMDIYPDNTLSKFQNRMDPPLELDGDWEVALNEIYFPLTFKPVLETPIQFKLLSKRQWLHQTIIKLEQNWTDDLTESMIVIDFGDSIEEIIEKVNQEMLQLFNIAKDRLSQKLNTTGEHIPPTFTLMDNQVTFRAGEIYLKEDEIPTLVKPEDEQPNDIPILDHHGEPAGKMRLKTFEKAPKFDFTMFLVPHFDKSVLVNTFGLHENFKNQIKPAASWEITGLPLQKDDNIFLMFIYTDIIRDHPVGGTLASVLRAVPLTRGVYENIGYSTFDNLIYYPVRKNFIDSISILLTQDTGEQLQFAPKGRVFLSLNFRRKIV